MLFIREGILKLGVWTLQRANIAQVISLKDFLSHFEKMVVLMVKIIFYFMVFL